MRRLAIVALLLLAVGAAQERTSMAAPAAELSGAIARSDAADSDFHVLLCGNGTPEVWQMDLRGHIYKTRRLGRNYCAIALRNGNVLISDYDRHIVEEWDAAGKVVWNTEGIDLPGSVGGLQELPNGNVLIANTDGNRVIEVSRKGAVVWEYRCEGHPYSAQRLANGRTLVCLWSAGRVVEVTPAGEVTFELGGFSVPHQAVRLENGHTLVADFGNRRVIEFDAAGKTYWQRPFKGGPSSACRLPSGRTIVSDFDEGVVIVDFEDLEHRQIWRGSNPGKVALLPLGSRGEKYPANRRPVEAENEFARANPGYKARAGAAYESDYLATAVENLAKEADLNAEQREAARPILRAFIYDWLDTYVRGGGSVAPEDLKRHLTLMDERFRGELDDARYAKYLEWRSDATGARNPLAFLMRPAPEAGPAAAGTPRGVVGLIAQLSSPDPLERAEAVAGLAAIGRPAYDALIQALAFNDVAVRAGAVEALGRIGDSRTIWPLIRALEDREELVRKSARTALAAIGAPAVSAVLDEVLSSRSHEYDFALQVRSILVAMGEPALAPLATAFREGDREARTFVGQVLVQMGGPAVPLLIALLKDKDGQVRVDAAKCLGEVKDRRAVPDLVAALEDPYGWVPWAAAIALGQIGDRGAVEPLLAALKGGRREARLGAAAALGRLKEPRALEPLLAALKDRDDDMRKAAADALGALGAKDAVEPLVRALGDATVRVRQAACKALGALRDERGVQPLVGLLRDQDADVRFYAVQALAAIGDPRAIPALAERLTDERENEVVRRTAATALGTFKDDRVIQPLIGALDDPTVRGEALVSLRRVTGQDLGTDAKAWLAWWQKNRAE